VTPESLDLLDHLLRFDHMDRFTCREAMAHAYFDPVRHLSFPEGAPGAAGAGAGQAE
jgi:casein kinase II subunit alpha